MKTKICIVTVLTFCLAACTKTEFNTKPTLEFKSSNSLVFQRGQLVEFVLKFTDKEGDIQNNLYIEEVTDDENCPANNFSTNETIPISVPQTANSEGEILVKYYYGINDPNAIIPTLPGPKCQRNDTCVFRFALVDKASNSSDTISSPQLVFVY